MTLKELGNQYRQSGEAVRKRARELETQLARPGMSKNERLELRWRIGMLNAMARDTIATARYLERYYRKERSW